MLGRVFAVLAAIAFVPFHALIAALIYLEDRGPVFYRSKRVGKDGRAIEMLKYRSMRVGATPKVDERFKTVVAADDERVTAVGRALRCGLDEIPQVVNIIRGEMAWIGPRPDELWMLPRYGPAIRERLAVLPGITGLAQVCDSRHLTTARSYALDAWEARHRTMALTLRIIFMTPLFMLGWRKVEFANREVADIERECERELELTSRVSKGTVMVIAAGPLQMPVIAAAREQGLRIVAVDANPAAPGLRVADSAHVLALDDYNAIRKVAERERVTAVTSLCTDFAVRAAAYVAEHLNLPGPSFEAAENATDKRRMRRRFALAGVPSVNFREVLDLESALAAAGELGYPVALKIPRSAGSRGIFRTDTDREMTERFSAARRYEAGGALLVESWLEGPEVSVEGCCFEGQVHIVQTTDKLVYPGCMPIEAGHTQGSRLGAVVERSIHECAAAGIRALGMDNCGFHAEIKVSATGPRIIEIAARLGGDRIATHLTPLSTGIDLVRAVLDISLGKAPEVTPKWERGSAIRYFQAGRSGVVAAIRGLEDIPNMPGFELLVAGTDRGEALQPGFAVPKIESSLDRYGYVIFSGVDTNEAADRAERAAAIEFEFVT